MQRYVWDKDILRLEKKTLVNISKNKTNEEDVIIKWKYSMGKDRLDFFSNRTIFSNGNFLGEFEVKWSNQLILIPKKVKHTYSRNFGCPHLEIDIIFPSEFNKTLDSLNLVFDRGNIIIRVSFLFWKIYRKGCFEWFYSICPI